MNMRLRKRQIFLLILDEDAKGGVNSNILSFLMVNNEFHYLIDLYKH